MKYATNFVVVFLGCHLLSSIFFPRNVAQAASLFPNIIPSSSGSKVCSILQTIVPCEVKIPDASELAWGAFGSLAYPLGAQEMQRRHPVLGVSLTPIQKQYFRPYFGNLVDRVTVHYNALLLTELGYPGTQQKVYFDNTEGQTFGLNIYISESYKTSFQQLALIGHELIHSQQFEQRGSSLLNFGRDYFEGYKSAGMNYENNPIDFSNKETSARSHQVK